MCFERNEWTPGSSSSPTEAITVLVVEDDAGIRALLRQLLQRLSVRILDATDGQEGIDTFRTHQQEIRLVIIDLSMPHLDGAEACRIMRSLRPELPLVLMSGHSLEEITERCRDLSLNAIIQKPFTLQQLSSLFEQVLPNS